MDINCKECGTSFIGYVSQGRQFCSKKCRNAYVGRIGNTLNIGDVFSVWKVVSYEGFINKGDRKRHVYNFECVNCGHIVLKTKCEINRNIRKNQCCMHCRNEERSKNGFLRLYQEYKKGAKKRHLTFELTENEFKKLVEGICFYCGSYPNRIVGHTEWSNYTCNGVDRLDSEKGYTLHNCVSCCEFCNRSKSNIDLDNYKNYIKNLVFNFNNNLIPIFKD